MLKLPNNVSSKYLFVLLAAERAKQLQQGAVPLVSTAHAKPTYRAMDELHAEKVPFLLTEKDTDLPDEETLSRRKQEETEE
ncbi:MAG: DNA-directed RNA polymerase subunit omega [Acidobacteria bacterium]|nr:DNA-directed RNA polymerase subunit omega [Acidobacteriota bacterium]